MRMRSGWILVLAASAGTLPGCSAGEGAAPVAEVRDSAGVRLVDNHGRVWTDETAWKVGAPLLEVGGLEVDPEYQLYEVVGVSVLSDGRVVVANNGSKELRFYDPEGRFLESVGRDGGGPGEFGRIWSLHRLPGDSLMIWDSGNVRFSIHDGQGRFVRTFKVDASPAGIARFPGMDPVVFADGSFLGLEWMGGMMDASPGIFRDTADYFLFDTGGRDLGAVASFPWIEMYVGKDRVQMRNGREMNRMGRLRFGRETSLSADDSTFWVTSGDSRILRMDRGGRLLQRVRRADLEPVPVTPDLADLDLELYMAQEKTHGHDQAQLDGMKRMREEMPVAEFLPAYRDLLVDGEHHLWARRDPGVDDLDAPSVWDIFEASGRFLGSLELPPRFEPFEIGGDYVLGVLKDELDIEHLQLLALTKPPV